jgi:cephalosporin-C deacetylase
MQLLFETFRYNILDPQKGALTTPVNEHWISLDTRYYILEWISKNLIESQ